MLWELLLAVLVLAASAPATAEEYTFTTLAGSAGSAGNADGTASAARFNWPAGVAVDGAGNIYVADTYNHTVRKVTIIGEVTTLAGLAGSSGSADGVGGEARFNYPQGLAVDGAGNVFVADQLNSTIRKVTPLGEVTTLAGLPGSTGTTDGKGSAARFNWPAGLALDGAGNIFVADTYNHAIRKVSPGGEVTTPAGLAGNSGSADGLGNTARFSYPWSTAVDGTGNVYVADTSNYTIRKMTPDGNVTTLAGLPGNWGSADGLGNAARFSQPFELAVDGAGCVFVADRDNQTIRKVSPTGGVTTLAGAPGSWGCNDGTGGAARFNYPQGVAVDNTGNIYVADVNNHSIRIGSACADAPTIDLAVGPVGHRRQLDTSPQTAVAWQWEAIQVPSDSRAMLSAPNRRNPTITPDVIGLYVFRLRATTVIGTFSIRTLAFTAVPAPPTIVTPPQSQTAEIGSEVSLGAAITNVAQGTICQWYFNDNLVLEGATNTALNFDAIQPIHAGTYTFVATNIHGSVTSTPAMLAVIPTVPRRTVPAVIVSGDPGSLVYLEYANALEPGPTWQALTSLTLTNPPQLWLDLTDPMPAARFYRAWQPDLPGVTPTLDVALATELTLTGTPGTRLRVDWINKFGPTDAWVSLATVTLTNATQTYVDQTRYRQPLRLYRLLPVP